MKIFPAVSLPDYPAGKMSSLPDGAIAAQKVIDSNGLRSGGWNFSRVFPRGREKPRPCLAAAASLYLAPVGGV